MIYALGSDYSVRPLRLADLDGPYPSWFEDQDVCRFNSHGKFFKSMASLRSYVEAAGGDDRIVWAICHAQDGHIGNISLQDISFLNRHAEFAILLGDRRHWGKGVGLLAGRQLLAHGFNKLGLERVHCGTAAGNTGMQKLALALGMREEGRRRAHLFLDGAFCDAIEYGILRSEFVLHP